MHGETSDTTDVEDQAQLLSVTESKFNHKAKVHL